jgi:hypothetical protein
LVLDLIILVLGVESLPNDDTVGVFSEPVLDFRAFLGFLFLICQVGKFALKLVGVAVLHRLQELFILMPRVAATTLVLLRGRFPDGRKQFVVKLINQTTDEREDLSLISF